MSRVIFLFALLLYCTTHSAQSVQRRWSITPRIGVNNSNVMGFHWYTTIGNVTKAADLVETTSKWGLTFGADVECMVNRRLGFSLGWYYSNEGYLIKQNASGSIYISGKKLEDDKKIKTSLHTFSFPFLVNFYVLPNLALKTGLQVDGLVSARQNYENQSSELPLNSLHTIGLGLPVALSFEFKNFAADVRYIWVFTNYCDVNITNRSKEVWNSRSLWMTLGYRFIL